MDGGTLGRHGAMLLLLCAEAWFLWNPEGWTFQWEPLIAVLAGIGAVVSSETYLLKKKPSQHDILLFDDFQRLLPGGTDPIRLIRTWDFGNAFDGAYLKPFYDFVREWHGPDREFIDQKLEVLRKYFYQKSEKLMRLIGKYTTPDRQGWHSVKPQNGVLNEDMENRIYKESKEMNAAAQCVVEAYDSLIRVAKQKLPPNAGR